MTLFEKIEYMARLGKDSIVEDFDGDKMIISHRKDKLWRGANNGYYRESILCSTLDGAAERYAAKNGCPEKFWDLREEEGWKFVGEFPRPEFERFKVGDKVKVIGEDHVYSIASVDDNMAYTLNRMITDSKSFLYVFDTNGGRLLGRKQAHHDQLTPVFDEDPAEKQEEPQKQEEQEKQEQKTITIDGVEYYLTLKG